MNVLTARPVWIVPPNPFLKSVTLLVSHHLHTHVHVHALTQALTSNYPRIFPCACQARVVLKDPPLPHPPFSLHPISVPAWTAWTAPPALLARWVTTTVSIPPPPAQGAQVILSAAVTVEAP